MESYLHLESRWRASQADITCMSDKSFTRIGLILVGIFMGCLNTPLAYKYIASLTYYDGHVATA